MESKEKFKIKWQEVFYLIVGYTVLIKVIIFNVVFFTHNKHTFGDTVYSFRYIGVTEMLLIIGGTIIHKKIKIIQHKSSENIERIFSYSIIFLITLLVILLIIFTCDPLYKFFLKLTFGVGAVALFWIK